MVVRVIMAVFIWNIDVNKISLVHLRDFIYVYTYFITLTKTLTQYAIIFSTININALLFNVLRSVILNFN